MMTVNTITIVTLHLVQQLRVCRVIHRTTLKPRRTAPMDISEYLRTQYLYNNPTENCCKSGESGALIPIND